MRERSCEQYPTYIEAETAVIQAVTSYVQSDDVSSYGVRVDEISERLQAISKRRSQLVMLDPAQEVIRDIERLEQEEAEVYASFVRVIEDELLSQFGYDSNRTYVDEEPECKGYEMEDMDGVEDQLGYLEGQ